jgi:hypothetical protein
MAILTRFFLKRYDDEFGDGGDDDDDDNDDENDDVNLNKTTTLIFTDCFAATNVI